MIHLGLDIGSRNIKIAQVEKKPDGIKLIALGSVPTPTRGLDSETGMVAVAEAIKKLYAEVRVSTKNVVAALPEDQVFTRVIELPPMSEKEVKAAIAWEAEQYIPVAISEVIMDYQIIGDEKVSLDKKTEVFLVAAPKKLVENYVRILELARLRPVYLETEMLALARALIVPQEKPNLLVEVGAKATDIAVVVEGQLVLTRSVPAAGEAITRALASFLGMEAAQAEEYKKAYGVDENFLEGKLVEAIGPVLNLLVKEIDKVKIFYQNKRVNEKAKIDRLILAGGTAGLPQLVSVLAKRLGIEVQIGDPFNLIKEGREPLMGIPEGMESMYSIAMGLALREV